MIKDKPEDLEALLSDQDVDMLEKAFDAFNRTTSRLQLAYKELKEHVQSLNLELEHANEELSANQNYLNNILQSLTNGVIVVDLDKTVTHINRAASELLWVSSQDAAGRPLSKIFKAPLDERDLAHHTTWHAGQQRRVLEDQQRRHGHAHQLRNHCVAGRDGGRRARPAPPSSSR